MGKEQVPVRWASSSRVGGQTGEDGQVRWGLVGGRGWVGWWEGGRARGVGGWVGGVGEWVGGGWAGRRV